MRNGERVFARAFKSWLVARASEPGASVAGLALRHGINVNQLRRWMKLLDATVSEPAALLPITIATREPAPLPCELAHAKAASIIEVELQGARVRVQGAVNVLQLRAVFEALRA